MGVRKSDQFPIWSREKKQMNLIITKKTEKMLNFVK